MFDPAPLLASGHQARREHRLEEARDLFAQAVAEYRFLSDRSRLVSSLKALGQAERDLRHPNTAIKCYREAAALQQTSGDQLGWAHSIRHVADILREQKNDTEAESAYNDTLAVYSTHSDTAPLDHANALRGFALLKDHSGDREQALLLWRAAKALYETSGVEAGVAECASHIAFLLHS
jgi:tetratricopeptide (TPR) repeat protein